MYLIHLSHIDLDGYGCQLVSKHFFKNYTMLNSNYGQEIRARVFQMIDLARQSSKKNILLLISDLNLTMQEAAILEEGLNEIKDKNIVLQLLDHHASGADVAKACSWYHLDTEICATKIVYEYLKSDYTPLSKNSSQFLEKFADMVDSIDMWHESDKYFEFGKVCMRLVSESREINRYMFDLNHREYKHCLLTGAMRYIDRENAHIELDDRILKLKKKYLRVDNQNDTLDNLTAKHVGYLLQAYKDNCSIYFNGARGFLSYNLGSISTIANEFLKNNEEFAFFMDISPSGRVSLRSSNRLDVSQLSKLLFDGGGHPNAAGGRMNDFKESFSYAEVKSIIDKLLKGREDGQA